MEVHTSTLGKYSKSFFNIRMAFLLWGYRGSNLGKSNLQNCEDFQSKIDSCL